MKRHAWTWLGMAGVMALGIVAQAQAQGTFRAAKLSNLAGTTTDATGIAQLVDVGSDAGGQDGRLDLLVASQAQKIDVLFGRADGSFSLGPSTDLYLIPTALAVTDLTGDGAPDLVVGDNSSTVSVWFGKNDGSFELLGPGVDVGLVPRGIALGDFNRDGKVDVVVTGESIQQVGLMKVLNGTGDGMLIPNLESIESGMGSDSLVAGDFNRDNRLDVAVANEIADSVAVFRGDGMGGFQLAQTVPVGTSPVAIGAADMNRDGRLDLVVANSNSDNVSVVDGRADGSFAPARSFPSGSPASTPRGLALGDIDGDGDVDAVVANNFSFDAGVLYGDGAGALSAPRLFVVDAEPLGVVVGDLNNDDRDDIVGLTRGAGSFPTAGTLLSLEGRRLSGVENLVVEVNPTQVMASDLNHDGLPDVVVAQGGNTSQPGTLRVSYASEGGSFGPSMTLNSGGDASGAGSGDFNGDGLPDLIALNRANSTVSVLLAQASGDFAPAVNLAVGAGANALATGDWNRDGRSDFAVAVQGASGTGRLQVVLARSGGGFADPVSIDVGQLPVALESGDFNGDGQLDLVTANNGSNNLSILLGSASGAFQPPTSVGVTNGPRTVAVADFDRDGHDDLAIGLSLQPAVAVLFGDGTGRFPTSLARPLNVGTGDLPSAVSARDVTGDGNPDVVVAGEVSSTVKVFARQVAPNVRGFLSAESFGVNRRPISLVTADFDGDGRYDAAAAASSPAPTTSVLTNIRAPGLLRGDGNGDGLISAADTIALMRKVTDQPALRVEDVALRGSYAASRGVDANGDGLVTPTDALSLVSLAFNGITGF